MDQTQGLQRMLQAAQEWGRRRWGQPVVVQSCGEPCCEEDGSLRCEVELRVEPVASPATAQGRKSQTARCLVTLEPDGTLGCFSPEELPDA